MKMEAGGTKCGVLAAALAVLLPVAAAAGDQTVVEREGDAIVYRGAITQQGNALVEALLADEGIEWLRITSVGGEVNLGMDLGDLVRGHGLNVEVVDYCASSCANYVFPAGRRKLLPADSVVVWHGSAIQSGIGALANIDFAPMEAHLGRTLSDEEKLAAAEEMGLTAYFDGLTRRQAEFYAAIGVDERVTVFGQEIDNLPRLLGAVDDDLDPAALGKGHRRLHLLRGHPPDRPPALARRHRAAQGRAPRPGRRPHRGRPHRPGRCRARHGGQE